MHVIRPRDEGADGELFSDRTAFFSGGAEDEESEEMDYTAVDGKMLQEDLDLEPDCFEEEKIKHGDDESFIVFQPRT